MLNNTEIIRCESCSAKFDLDLSSVNMKCPYCGTVNPLAGFKYAESGIFFTISNENFYDMFVQLYKALVSDTAYVKLLALIEGYAHTKGTAEAEKLLSSFAIMYSKLDADAFITADFKIAVEYFFDTCLSLLTTEVQRDTFLFGVSVAFSLSILDEPDLPVTPRDFEHYFDTLINYFSRDRYYFTSEELYIQQYIATYYIKEHRLGIDYNVARDSAARNTYARLHTPKYVVACALGVGIAIALLLAIWLLISCASSMHSLVILGYIITAVVCGAICVYTGESAHDIKSLYTNWNNSLTKASCKSSME